MELKKRVLNLKFNGGEFQVNFPTVKQLKEDAKPKEGETELDATIRFLSALGLPAEVALEMEAVHIQEIVVHLTDQKKSK